VVTHEVPPGTALTKADITWRHFEPTDPVPRDFQGAKQLIGRVVKHRLLPDEPILASRLFPDGTPAGSAAFAGADQVLVEVPVSPASEMVPVGGFIDLIWSRPAATCTLLQYVPVVGVGSRSSQPGHRLADRLTLVVPASEEVRFAAALSEGTLRPVLRNSIDDHVSRATCPTSDAPGQ
jgi:Flp pilus assembly protein CpaB